MTKAVLIVSATIAVAACGLAKYAGPQRSFIKPEFIKCAKSPCFGK